MSNEDFTTLLAAQFKQCANPPNYKEAIVGEVTVLEPLSVKINEGKIFLKENKNLIISEWFRFRCNIDKTIALSEGVPNDLQSAKGVSETHSYTGSPCNMPSAIEYLANAVSKVNTELLALKCSLNIGDLVIILPTEVTDKYILADKLLEK